MPNMTRSACSRCALMHSVAALALIAGVGCSQAGGDAAMRDVIMVGTTKADPFGIPAEYRALHAGMEEALGRPVRFNPQPGGEAISQQLTMGDMKFAILSAQEYASIPDASHLKLLASAVNEMGRTSRKGLLIARASDQRFKSVADCAAKRFAFGTYKDLLTDYAARKALERGGVPTNKLLPELLPPPFCWEQRLYVQNDAAVKIALDLTVNAGVVDESVFNKLPATGGNPISGPSKDQFKVIGETDPVPELVIVAGPGAAEEDLKKLTDYLLNRTAENEALCKQLMVKGFAPSNRSEYDALKALMPS
ncbi:ABC transporter, phosphonate, periplasmic substrate-binding protein [Phycisphaerae bacterium RAS2]|nr:ABC transporter, phosphonate, periplasmic substrate-binding protein [Phycisphaerae bacterium RAS2]